MADRGIIESNPIIAKKERAHLRQIHLAKLRNMKTSLDTSLPRGLKIRKRKLVRKRNLKREQQTEEWLTSVERENRRLLEKMSLVMLGKDQDPGRYKLAAKYKHFNTVNGPARAREQKRIDKDNAISAERINRTTAFYRTDEWLEERRHMEAKIKYMCKFDAPLLKNSKRLYVVKKGDKKKGRRGRKGKKGTKRREAEAKKTKEEKLMLPLRGAKSTGHLGAGGQSYEM